MWSLFWGVRLSRSRRRSTCGSAAWRRSNRRRRSTRRRWSPSRRFRTSSASTSQTVTCQILSFLIWTEHSLVLISRFPRIYHLMRGLFLVSVWVPPQLFVVCSFSRLKDLESLTRGFLFVFSFSPVFPDSTDEVLLCGWNRQSLSQHSCKSHLFLLYVTKH